MFLLFIQIIHLTTSFFFNSEINETKKTIFPIPNFFAVATIDSVYDGYLNVENFKKQKKLQLISDKKNFEIRGFTLMLNNNGFWQEYSSINEYFTVEMLEKIQNNKYYNDIWFYNIIGVLNKQDTFLLNNIRISFNEKDNKKYKLNNEIKYPIINSIYSGNINFANFLAMEGIKIYSNSDDLLIISSEFNNYGEGYTYSAISNSYIISREQKKYASCLKTGSCLWIYNIKAITLKKDTVLLPPMVLRLM